MQVAKYIVLFILIQLASLVLTIAGIPVVGVLVLCRAWTYDSNTDKTHFPRFFWIWDNEEDGVEGPWHQREAWTTDCRIFVWSALRNPCNNLRYVKGISKIGRPLWRKTWGAKPGGWYVQAGWNSSGFPVLSGGRNANPF